jgi:phenylpropionate dioxygenase-like ring-hydroxylating dioxygenase large terminal subunit
LRAPGLLKAWRLNLEQYRIFNRRDAVAEGWYWLLPSNKLKRGQVRPVHVAGSALAVFRGKTGTVAALDAYCPHMGAHLAEGRVEGDELRCFFHGWRFNAGGECTDIPCLDSRLQNRVSTTSWHVAERYGLIWIWLGKDAPQGEMPNVPGLPDDACDISLGNAFVKECHPNVVMVNAIDEQHFRTVHRLPGSILSMQPLIVSAENIEFRNTGKMPTERPFGRFLALFYRDCLTYNLSYWYGSTGTVTFGPDFLHLHLMFALRLNAEGKTEGRTIVFTRKRKGVIGWIFNRVILSITKLGGYYFAIGDTRIFKTIRFNFKTPIPADRAVMAFIAHLEEQADYAVTLTPSGPLCRNNQIIETVKATM